MKLNVNNTNINFQTLYNILVYGKNIPTLNYNVCNDCGGLGVIYLTCCNDTNCGCLGLPYDFESCKCGIKFPTDTQLLNWK